jgi:predicted ferric reductase
MRHTLRATFWIIVYFLLIFLPFIILLIGPRPEGREFWREFSVALGFAGLSLMGLQFIPTARLPFLAEVYPMDTLYTFHHRVSILSFVLVAAHPIILFINNPFTLQLLNVFTAPGRARAGVIALLAMIVLVGDIGIPQAVQDQIRELARDSHHRHRTDCGVGPGAYLWG